MEVEVTFVTRRGNAVIRRSRRIEARRIRIGRGTGNEVQLSDIRVDLSAAAVFPRSGMLTILAQGPSPIRVNGRNSRMTSINPGDEILIGPYRISLSEPPAGCDGSLTIELVQPLGDALGRLILQAQPRLGAVIFSKRAASWTGFTAIVLLFLLAPLLVHSLKPEFDARLNTPSPRPVDAIALSWEPGELSNSHRFFGANCAACHRDAFARVPDEACTACHGGIGKHIGATASARADPRHIAVTNDCTGCHQEHRGAHGIVVGEARLCQSCHSQVTATPATDGMPQAMAFPMHRQFRVTVVADSHGPRFERIELAARNPPQNRPGLKFSHSAHLVAGGFPTLGYRPMVCADCHVAAPGPGFRPISYKQQCERCHSLEFERQDLPWPTGKVPHGDDVGVAAAVWNFYAGKALQGGIADPIPAVARRLPGATVATIPMAEPNPQAWVAEKTEAALRTVIFDKNRGCAYCHFGTGQNGAFDLSGVLSSSTTQSQQPPPRLVSPVVLHQSFLPRARFDHDKHASSDCESCHDARHAESSAAVLIPGIENCLGCHGSEAAAFRVESTCITCHSFHRNESVPLGAAASRNK